MTPTKKISKALPFLIAAGAITGGVIAWFKSRTGIPDGAVAIAPFEIDRYLGKWYEIARYDYHFEKNLKNVTAEYALSKDGSIIVINRGQDSTTGAWEGAIGKAKFIGKNDEARLKVSFFGPFYAAYNVIAIDDDYQNALVVGNDLEYIWLLSRQPEMPENIREQYLEQASGIGYDIGKLIWTPQRKKNSAK